MIETNVMKPIDLNRWKKAILRNLFLYKKNIDAEELIKNLNKYPLETQFCGGRLPLRVLLDYVDQKLSDNELDVLALYFDEFPKELDLVIGIERFYEDTGMNRKELETYLAVELPGPEFLYEEKPSRYPSKPHKDPINKNQKSPTISIKRKFLKPMSYAASIVLPLMVSVFLINKEFTKTETENPRVSESNNSSLIYIESEPIAPAITYQTEKTIHKASQIKISGYKNKKEVSNRMASLELFTDLITDK